VFLARRLAVGPGRGPHGTGRGDLALARTLLRRNSWRVERSTTGEMARGRRTWVYERSARPVPVAFALATFGVVLIAYTFVRLCQRFHHAGSVYGSSGEPGSA
jgi:hypothetical protein